MIEKYDIVRNKPFYVVDRKSILLFNYETLSEAEEKAKELAELTPENKYYVIQYHCHFKVTSVQTLKKIGYKSSTTYNTVLDNYYIRYRR